MNVHRLFGRLSWLAVLALPAAGHGEMAGLPCAAFDSPDPNAPYPYSDWRCQDITLPVIDETVFEVRLRWNRPGLASEATVIWLAGADGSPAHAEFERGVAGADDERSLRERLDQDAGIRSIEVQFINPPDPLTGLGGYWAPPQAGYLKAARAYRAAFDHLRQPAAGLLRGGWTTHVGSSNGSTVIAFALAWLDGDRWIDQAVLISGPFLGDVLRECTDPDFSAYMGQNDGLPGRVSGDAIRATISRVNGWDDCRTPGLDATRRSALGNGAVQVFPDTGIEVFLGVEDETGPWLLASNAYWYGNVFARHQARTLLPGIDHSPWGVDAVTQERLFKAIAKRPGHVAEGLFTVAGRHIHYSNGSHYCYFPTMAVYHALTGRDDIEGLTDHAGIPHGMVYDGHCGGGVPVGLFTVAGRDIHYSNGSHYCYFPTMELYHRLTGRSDITGVPDLPMLPGQLTFAGFCQG